MNTIRYNEPTRRRIIRLPHFVNRFAVALHTSPEPTVFHWVIAAMKNASEARTLTPDLGPPEHDPEEFAEFIRTISDRFKETGDYVPDIPDETFQAFKALCRRKKLSVHQGAEVLISWHALHDSRAFDCLTK